MAVLCHDALRGIGIHLGPIGVLAGVVGITVKEEDAVGILLDGTGVTQVRQLGPVRRVVALLLHRTGQLRKCDNGHIHFLSHDLQVSGDGADLLHTVLAALAGGHQLQVVDNDQAHIGAGGVLIDPADLRLHLGDGDA